MPKYLDKEMWRIVKEITIISENASNSDIIGSIIYSRKLSDEYKLNEDEEKYEYKYKKSLNYPKQELFPSDESDQIILKSIQVKYPKSIIKNYIEIFEDYEGKGYHFILKQPSVSVIFEVIPDFSTLNLNILSSENVKFNCFHKEIKIYKVSGSKSIDNTNFTTECNLDGHEEIFSRLSEIEFR